MIRKGALVAIDEGHAIARIAAQDAAFAQRQRLELRQEKLADEIRHLGAPRRIDREGWMNIETVAAARTGLRAEQARMPVGDEYDAREIAAEQRLERGAQLAEIARQCLFQNFLRVGDRRQD